MTCGNTKLVSIFILSNDEITKNILVEFPLEERNISCVLVDDIYK